MKPSTATIYYFSGTGNAKRAANWIAEVGNENKVECKALNIEKLQTRKNLVNPASDLIGFAAPTHGFNFPPIMMHFIMRFPKAKKNQKIFIVNTRAGMKLGKLFLPGISGLAQLFSALVLLLKGYKIVGMKPIDLPSNWISLHPGIRKSVVESIHKKRELTTKKFAKRIFNGKRNYRALFDVIQDLLVSPIAPLYYLIGRFILAKTFIATADCTNCNLCINSCPVNAIKYVNDRPYWTYKCESCMRCMNDCPTRAIETAHGFIIAFTVLVDGLFLYKVNQWFNYEAFINNVLPKIISGLVILSVNSIVFFVFLLLAYRMLYLLNHKSWFDKIIMYTSFTKYKFWRRYKLKKK